MSAYSQYNNKSFSRFLENIHYYPDYFLESQLQAVLLDADITLLKNMGLLQQGSDIKEIPCQSCDDDHFLAVKVEKGKLYYFCPQSDISRNYLDPGEVRTWQFNVEGFLQMLALQLHIDGNVEKLEVKGMWQIGGFSKDDARYNCYYFQGRNFHEALAFIERQPSHMRRYILFTNQGNFIAPLTSGHSFLCIEITELIEVKSKHLSFKKKLFDEFLITGFRSVLFNSKNGDLTVNGKPIASITPSTAEYYFTELLWKHFNEPVPHQSIKRHIYIKTGKDYDDGPQKLCHKQKNKIKKEADEPALIDQIFKTTKDYDGKNAYIMRNPS